jgi:hypothetical protein
MRFEGFRCSVFALLYLFVVVLFGAASADAVAKNNGNQGQFTKVGTIYPGISPSQPPSANTPFKLTATFVAISHGQKCEISNVSATINNVEQPGNPRSAELHNGGDSTTFHFDFDGFPEGTALTPTFSYTAEHSNGKGSCGCIPDQNCLMTQRPSLRYPQHPNLT